MQGPWHSASVLATTSSDMPCCWVQSPSPLHAAFPMSASAPARQSPRAHGAEWDRDTRHNRVAKLGVWGGSRRLRQGRDNQCLREKICLGRGTPAWATDGKGSLLLQWRWERCSVCPCITWHFPQHSATLGHRRDSWPGRHDALLLPAFRQCTSASFLCPSALPTTASHCPCASGSAASCTPLAGLPGLPGAGLCSG